MHSADRRMVMIIAGLAAVGANHAVADTLIGSDVGGNVLLAIDPQDGTYEGIGTISCGLITGLAYDPVGEVLYGSNPGADQIFLIDLGTAMAEPLGEEGALGQGNWNGLAYDPNHQILYVVSTISNGLFSVDLETGEGTFVTWIMGIYGEIEGLAFDPATNTLYGLSNAADQVVSIDPLTGLTEPVTDVLPESGHWNGLAFDTTRGLLFATRIIGTELYAIDPASGEVTYIGPTGGPDSSVQGLAYVAGSLPCPSDINGDDVVNVVDLLMLLGAWGEPGGPGDINGDGIVGVIDLLTLLADWGPCE